MHIIFAYNIRTDEVIYSNTLSSISDVTKWAAKQATPAEWIPVTVNVNQHSWTQIKAAIELHTQHAKMASMAEGSNSDIAKAKEEREKAREGQFRKNRMVNPVGAPVELSESYIEALKQELKSLDMRIDNFTSHIEALKETIHTENEGAVKSKVGMYASEIAGLAERKEFILAQLIGTSYEVKDAVVVEKESGTNNETVGAGNSGARAIKPTIGSGKLVTGASSTSTAGTAKE